MATQQIPSPALAERSLLAAELADIAERSLTFTKAAGAVVLLLRGDELVLAAKAGPVMDHPAPMSVAGSFAGKAVQSARVARCDDVDGHPDVNVLPFLPLRVRSLVAVPICVSPRKVAGVLIVLSDTAVGFLRTHLAILQTLADVAAEKCRHEPAIGEAAVPSVPLPPQPTLITAAQTAVPAAQISATMQMEPRTSHEPVISLAEAAKPLSPPKFSARAYSSPRPRVISAYDRPQTIFRESRPKRAPVAFAVVVIAFLATFGALWARSHRSAQTVATAAASLTPAPPAPAPAAATTSSQPAASAQPAPPVPPVEDAKKLSAPKPKVDRAVPREAIEVQPEEEAAAEEPAPLLRQHAASARPKPTDLDAPKLLLGGTAVPELPSVKAAMPVALSKPVPPRLITRVAPDYPTLLLHLHQEGSVALRVHINAQGEVERVEMTGGNKNFLHAAEAAVKQWNYAPASLDGKAIASSAEVTIHFTLPKK